MSQKRDFQPGDSGALRVRAWLTEYGDLVALLMVLIVLLYTINWASGERQAEESATLVRESLAELKSFCEEELAPEDYHLEQVRSGILIHLPANRWFRTDRPVIEPGMRGKLEKLSRKISALKLVTQAPLDELQVGHPLKDDHSDVVRIQLSISQVPEQPGQSPDTRRDNLFLARANQLATALNETLRVQDYQFVIHPNPSGMVQGEWTRESLWNGESRNNLTLLISASLESN